MSIKTEHEDPLRYNLTRDELLDIRSLLTAYGNFADAVCADSEVIAGTLRALGFAVKREAAHNGNVCFFLYGVY